MIENETYQVLIQFGLFAIVVEGALKALFSTKAYSKLIVNSPAGDYISKPSIAIVVSCFLCWQSKFDILSKISDSEITTIGIILTGLAISRGSNGISDFLNRRKLLKEALIKNEVEQIKNGNKSGATKK